MIRVLVVDDSAFARKVMRQILAPAGDIEVVDIARDGLEALERIEALRPDVITLDLVMPHLDGLGVLRSLAKQGAPRVVVVSTSDADSELGIQALELGAVDVVAKPTALASDRLFELRDDLLAKVRAAAGARPLIAAVEPEVAAVAAAATKVELVVVGTSTGGPPALTHLLTALPADFPVPIAVALHIPAGFTEALARRLARTCRVRVVEASDGLVLEAGMVAIARGGEHLCIVRDGERLAVRVGPEPSHTAHKPSVDVLFESAVRTVGPAVLGVVLTGMGDDGLAGARAIRGAGGRVLTESPESCVVYGMPRAVAEAGLSAGRAPIHLMAEAIVRAL